MRFRRYIVADGDSIQSIAQRLLGDISQWVELARFNNLRYPYIVSTNEEKLENPEHLVTTGDTLLVQITEEEQQDYIESVVSRSDYETEEMYALALGKDIDVMPMEIPFGETEYDSEFLELKRNNKGDVKTVKGLNNLRQALFNKVTTPKGSYLGHPEYGSNVHLYVGKKNTEENATLLDLEIERTLRTDGRVKNVHLHDHVIDSNRYSVYFTIEPITVEEAFDFVLSAYSSGPIVLEDTFRDIR